MGVGGNFDGAPETVASAIDSLDGEAGIRVTARSSLYRSAPRDYADQADFVNAVARISTAFSPIELLDRLQVLENGLGRRRDGPRFGPRLIDLDLLLYDDLQYRDERLELPHPRMHQRRFVLEPLLEIAPDAVIPGHGRADEHLAACLSQRVSRLASGEN